MFNTIITLMRGRAAAAGEQVADRNALVILDQQMRDATGALERAKKATALAIAQDRQEGQRLDGIIRQIGDLEVRVSAALEAGNEALAREGAEAVARLEADRDAAQTARSLFAAEIERLRAHVIHAEGRIAALDRGRRIARAAQAVRGMRQGRIEEAGPYQSTLSEAEATLKRLREHQAEAQAAEEALDEIDAASGPARAAEKLAAEGFGPRLKTSADDVLARLRNRQAHQAA